MLPGSEVSSPLRSAMIENVFTRDPAGQSGAEGLHFRRYLCSLSLGDWSDLFLNVTCVG